METKNSTYLILTIILVILSAIGGYFLFQTYQTQNTVAYNSTTIPKIELIPTDSPQDEPKIPETSTSSATITPVATSTAKTTITPTKTKTTTTTTPTPTPTKTITPTKIITKTPTASPTSSVVSSSTLDYSSATDGFSVAYSAKRKLYQDTESSGNRYTFSSTSGNFAIHVSSSGIWSWVHPDRQFSQSFLIADQPTFRYDIAAQTIVDVQSSDKNYTLQCVHNGVASLKTECEAFMSSFKLL